VTVLQCASDGCPVSSSIRKVSRTATPGDAFSKLSYRTDRMIPNAVLKPHMIMDDVPIKREADGVYDNIIFDLSEMGIRTGNFTEIKNNKH